MVALATSALLGVLAGLASSELIHALIAVAETTAVILFVFVLATRSRGVAPMEMVLAPEELTPPLDRVLVPSSTNATGEVLDTENVEFVALSTLSHLGTTNPTFVVQPHPDLYRRTGVCRWCGRISAIDHVHIPCACALGGIRRTPTEQPGVFVLHAMPTEQAAQDTTPV